MGDKWNPARKEVSRLKEDGVDVIIALGHSGYDKGRAGAAVPASHVLDNSGVATSQRILEIIE